MADKKPPVPLEELVDKLLAKHRPERTDNRDWMEPVIERTAEELEKEDQQKIRMEYARRIVGNREKAATSRMTKFLHTIFDNGQLPLGWPDEEFVKDIVKLPVRINDDERVQFGAMNPNDWKQIKLNDERYEEHRDELVQKTFGAYDLILKWLEEQQVYRTDLLSATWFFKAPSPPDDDQPDLFDE